MAKSKNYLNKKDLLEEIYKSREQDELTPECLKMLMLLANKTIKKLYYKCEDDKQHALSEAYYDLSKNWRKFDPDFAKYHGYEDLKPGDQIRVCPEKGSDRTAAATVVENYPIENLIEEKRKYVKSIGGVESTFEYVYEPETKELRISYILKENYDRKTGEGKCHTEGFDASDYNRIKLEYIVKKNQTDIDIFDKEQIIIKDPNPFSFFTSSCINGYAKGWKRLYPKKSKGLMMSLDSGFDTEGDGLYSY